MESITKSLEPLKKLADDNMEWTYTFAGIGLCYTGYRLLQDLYGMYRYAIRPSKDLKARYGDGWVVVTGASDGIGKALAFELAKRGFKIGLIGRNQEKLDKVAEEIKAAHNVETQVGVFDFNVHYTDDKIKELSDVFDKFDKVSLFICNAGIANFNKLHEMPENKVHEQINVNVAGTTMCARLIIPKLLENEKSGLYFIGSSAYLFPTAGLSVYTAWKSYVHYLAVCLQKEYEGKIDVMVTTTSSVKTNMNSGRYLFTITPEQHAKHALDKLGHDTVTHPHYTHAIAYYYKNRLIEGSIIDYINNKRRLQFLAERDQKLKEEAEAAKNDENK